MLTLAMLQHSALAMLQHSTASSDSVCYASWRLELGVGGVVEGVLTSTTPWCSATSGNSGNSKGKQIQKQQSTIAHKVSKG